MKIFILTEAGKNIGLGHLTRCIAISQALKEKGQSPLLLVNADKSIKGVLKNEKYRIVNWGKFAKRTLKSLRNADAVIVDSYLAGKVFYLKLASSVKTGVYIDDNKRLDYPPGIVINGNVYAKQLNYPRRKTISYILGTKFAPLRKEFKEVTNKRINRLARNIMVTFGNNDHLQMTQKILRLLVCNYPDLNKTVIIGRGFNKIAPLKRSMDKKTKLVYFPDATGMKKIMLDSDIAVSAGGQTLYELARVGVPTIAAVVSGNQVNNVRGWEKAGFIIRLGINRGKISPKEFCNSLNLLMNYKQRKMKSRIGNNSVDGKGTMRIAERILNNAQNSRSKL